MTELDDHADVTAVKALITSFFDAINASDAQTMGSLFFEQAHLVILRQDPPLPPSSAYYAPYASIPIPESGSKKPQVGDEETLTVVVRTSIETFVRMIEEGKKRREGKPGPVLHEAPDLNATEVKVDKLFGMAWSPFSVTFDGVLHHYGTMVYTLGKAAEGGQKVWKIEGLTQNYRRTPGWDSPTDLGT